MITFDVPGSGRIMFSNLVMDFNGTMAIDGLLIPGIDERLHALSQCLSIVVLTADTNSSVRRECANLPVSIRIIEARNQSTAKMTFVKELASGVACIGNGANDERMFEAADLAIAVLGPEGCYVPAMLHSDVIVPRIEDGLDLLLNPNRLIGSLRT